MKFAALAVSLAVVLVGAGPALAATHADPAGDNCKEYGTALDPFMWCGFDISSASDVTDPNGTVHLRLAYLARTCDRITPPPFSGPSSVAFELYDTTVSAPAVISTHLIAQIGGTDAAAQIDQFTYSPTFSRTTTPLTATTTVVGVTTTFDVAIPPTIASALGAFRWLGSNTCIGELPQQASDIAPNTGLYEHAGGGGTGGGVTLAAITSAVKGTLAAAQAKSAATLVKKGGFPATFTAPGAGTLTVALKVRGQALLGAGASGHVARAAKAVMIATLRLTVTKAGKVTRTVKLTKSGKKLLKGAKKTISATLTISFKAGALVATKSRVTKISPRKR